MSRSRKAQWLHDLLAPVVAEVVVCDRRGQGSHGSRADHSDAEQLAELLRQGALRAVYHRNAERAAVKELARTYQNLVEDATRVMLRLKALFRGRGIKTPGRSVYDLQQRSEWLRQLPEAGARFRAHVLYTELELLQQLRPQAKAALLREAQRDRAWAILRTIPFLGPVRVALLLATMQTPWRFRTNAISGHTPAWPSSPGPAPSTNCTARAPCVDVGRR
jgi:transposase